MSRLLSLPVALVQNLRGGVPRPSFCTYLVCYRCNARCGMCDSWRVKPGRELRPHEAREVFGKIGDLDVVRLSGGEPFLREDFLEVAAAVFEASRPWVVHITTNGSFPERVARFVERFPDPRRLHFMVSFDGLAEEHDQNRGKDVTFERALETVRAVVALRHKGADVSVNHTVISARSIEDGEALRREMDALDVEVHSVLAYADSSMYSIKLRGKKAEHLIVPAGYPLHPKLAGADVIGFVDAELARARRMSPALRAGKEYYLRGLRARLQKEPSPRPSPRCVALRSHIRLLPDGRVPVCQFNTETVGDLLTQSFEEVWHGSAAASQRKWVDECPGCWAECEVMPSAIYTGDIALEGARRIVGALREAIAGVD